MSEWEKFKVQVVLVFHSCSQLTASDSDVDESFRSMHQSIMTEIKKYACEDWIVLDVIIKHNIKIFEY